MFAEPDPLFHDRFDAGRRLAREFRNGGGLATVVVGLDRGGVQVASEVARALASPAPARHAPPPRPGATARRVAVGCAHRPASG
jgi:hypothetical protein